MAHLRDLQARGPPRGYLPELTKSILVIALRNLARAEEFVQVMGLNVVTWSRYIGGVLRESKAEKIWMARKVAGWAESVVTPAGVSRKYPQYAYSGLQKSLQQKWVFVQWVNPGIGDPFGPVEKALWETLFPELFEELGGGSLE